MNSRRSQRATRLGSRQNPWRGVWRRPDRRRSGGSPNALEKSDLPRPTPGEAPDGTRAFCSATGISRSGRPRVPRALLHLARASARSCTAPLNVLSLRVGPRTLSGRTDLSARAAARLASGGCSRCRRARPAGTACTPVRTPLRCRCRRPGRSAPTRAAATRTSPRPTSPSAEAYFCERERERCCCCFRPHATALRTE